MGCCVVKQVFRATELQSSKGLLLSLSSSEHEAAKVHCDVTDFNSAAMNNKLAQFREEFVPLIPSHNVFLWLALQHVPVTITG